MRRTNTNSLIHRLSIKHWIAALAFAVILTVGPAVLGHQPVFAADSCSAPATNYGAVTATAAIPKTGSYTVWTHMEIPSSSANSLLLNVGGTCYTVGASTSIPVNTWEWIDYYDGKTTNTISQSLNQGNESVVLTGTSSGVLVDQIEFVSGTCTPTGDGSNCASTTGTTTGGGGTTTGGTTSDGGGSGGNGGAGGGYVTYLGDDGTLTPTDTDIPTEVTTPFTVQPTTSDSTSDPVIEAQYYLNKKLLATVTKSPFSYTVNTKHILNGTYTLTTKTIYTSGKVVTTSQKLIVKNPFSLMQALLTAEHYVVFEAIALIILIIGFVLLRKWIRSHRTPSDNPPLTDANGGSGDSYTPLSYAQVVSPTEAPTPYPAPQVQPPMSPASPPGSNNQWPQPPQ